MAFTPDKIPLISKDPFQKPDLPKKKTLTFRTTRGSEYEFRPSPTLLNSPLIAPWFNHSDTAIEAPTESFNSLSITSESPAALSRILKPPSLLNGRSSESTVASSSSSRSITDSIFDTVSCSDAPTLCSTLSEDGSDTDFPSLNITTPQIKSYAAILKTKVQPSAESTGLIDLNTLDPEPDASHSASRHSTTQPTDEKAVFTVQHPTNTAPEASPPPTQSSTAPITFQPGSAVKPHTWPNLRKSRDWDLSPTSLHHANLLASLRPTFSWHFYKYPRTDIDASTFSEILSWTITRVSSDGFYLQDMSAVHLHKVCAPVIGDFETAHSFVRNKAVPWEVRRDAMVGFVRKVVFQMRCFGVESGFLEVVEGGGGGARPGGVEGVVARAGGFGSSVPRESGRWCRAAVPWSGRGGDVWRKDGGGSRGNVDTWRRDVQEEGGGPKRDLHGSWRRKTDSDGVKSGAEKGLGWMTENWRRR